MLSPISERMLTCLIQNETAHYSFRDTGIDKQNENHTVILSGEKITKKEIKKVGQGEGRKSKS